MPERQFTVVDDSLLAIVLTWALAGLGIVFGLALGVVLVLLLGSLFLEADE